MVVERTGHDMKRTTPDLPSSSEICSPVATRTQNMPVRAAECEYVLNGYRFKGKGCV